MSPLTLPQQPAVCRPSGAIRYSLVLLVMFLGPWRAAAQSGSIVFPAGSGVTNMVTDYGLIKDDSSSATATHNSDMIQKAIDDRGGRNDKGAFSQLLYFPDGTYYINKKLTFGMTNETSTQSRNVTFQGQSRDGTVIRLRDATPGFDGLTTAVTPMLVFFEPKTSGTESNTNASFNNNAMGNYVRNLTFDTGANNPNAVAIDFISNNYGGISDVTIKTRDSQHRGKIGLKMDVKLGGIGYIKNVRVEGFDYGIQVKVYITDYVFEDIELVNQRVAGLTNLDKPIQIRRLTSRNSVPAIIHTPTINPNTPGVGSIVILESELYNTGASSTTTPAINNREGGLFARDLTITYPVRLLDQGKDRSKELPDGGELSTRGVYGINGLMTTGVSMNLPIKDAPDLPWDESSSDWYIVDPRANDTFKPDGTTLTVGDDTDEINKAITSGKSTVCIRYGNTTVSNTIKFPDNHKVKRFLMLGQIQVVGTALTTNDVGYNPSNKKPVFEIGTGTNAVLLIEGIRTFNGKYYQYIQNNSTKTLILRHNALYGANRVYRNKYSSSSSSPHTPGTLFIEDMATLAEQPYDKTQPGPGFLFDHQEVYARSFNPENVNPHMLNQGGKVVILGFKTEGEGVPFATSQGGFTEVLGGEVNGVFRTQDGSGNYVKTHQEIINNEDSNVSIIATERGRFDDTVRDTIVAETRNGVTKYLLKGVIPLTSKSGDFAPSTDIPLYISYNTAPVATTNANQIAIVDKAFSYTVKAFTDNETPNSLTYTASGLPAGLTFAPSSRVISGIATTTGSSKVTITATDPGKLSSSTSFTITGLERPVVISQVYGGAGVSGVSIYTNDFIELFNRSNKSVSINGWSLQSVAGSNGNFSPTTVNLSGTITPGQYYLVRLAGGTEGTALPTADASNTAVNLGSQDGKVALVNSTASLACGSTATPCTDAQKSRILDLVGYGASNLYEGNGPVPPLSNILAGFRNNNGCMDTNNNNTDFISDTPKPRNSASPRNVCTSGAPRLSATPSDNALLHTSNQHESIEQSKPLSVTIMGNPLQDGILRVNVQGARAESLRLSVTDINGKVVAELFAQEPVSTGQYVLDLGGRPSGTLLLRVSTPTQGQTVKVLKQ